MDNLRNNDVSTRCCPKKKIIVYRIQSMSGNWRFDFHLSFNFKSKSKCDAYAVSQLDTNFFPVYCFKIQGQKIQHQMYGKLKQQDKKQKKNFEKAIGKISGSLQCCQYSSSIFYLVHSNKITPCKCQKSQHQIY